MSDLAKFIKYKRRQASLTQQELADRSGVGLRFIRELEAGKPTIRLDKADQVLRLFGHKMGPVELKRRTES